MDHVPHSQLCDARARLVNCAGEGGRSKLVFPGRETESERAKGRETEGRDGIEKSETCRASCVFAMLKQTSSAAHLISGKQHVNLSLLKPTLATFAPAERSRVKQSLTLDWAKFTE